MFCLLRFRVGFLLVVFACLTGCAQGVVEFQSYSQAFNTQFAEGELVLDGLARAERIVGKRRDIRGRKDRIRSFNPDSSAYYIDSVDPPLTASIRNSAKALKAYNEALGGLANGEAAAALTNRIGQISSNLIAAGAATYLAAASPAVAGTGVEKWVGKAGESLKLALPLFQRIAGLAAQEAFRQQLVAAYPAMHKLLSTLREGTPDMFFMYRRSYAVRGSEDPSGVADVAAVEKYRTQLAGWVLLLDKTLEAMDAAAIAAMNDMPAVDLARVTDASLELKILAEKVKAQRNR